MVCRQLGFVGALSSGTGPSFGYGRGPIWFTNVNCSNQAGAGSSFAKCQRTLLGEPRYRFTGSLFRRDVANVVCKTKDRTGKVLLQSVNNIHSSILRKDWLKKDLKLPVTCITTSVLLTQYKVPYCKLLTREFFHILTAQGRSSTGKKTRGSVMVRTAGELSSTKCSLYCSKLRFGC